MSSEPERGERRGEACSHPDKRDQEREGEMVPCRDQRETRDQVRNKYDAFSCNALIMIQYFRLDKFIVKP